MPFVLRALMLLAAVTPLFAATAFHPAWWQTLIAAAIGSALGQLAVRLTRGHRIAAIAVAAAAALIAALAAGWVLVHGTPHPSSSAPGFLVVRSPEGGRPTLTWDDVDAIETKLPAVHLAVPYLHNAEQLASEDQNWNTQVVGTTPAYFELRDLHVAAGELFHASNPEPGTKVVVLGQTVVAQLYGAGKLPVGEHVRIRNMPFTIIAVLAHQGMSKQGQDFDDVAIVPLDVYESRIALELKSRFSGAVLVSATSREDATLVEAQLRTLLRDRHRLAPGDEDDFVIRTPIPE